MDYTKVLKRSWHIVRQYRMLWVFGFILALVAGEGGGYSGSQYSSGRGFPPSEGGAAMPQIPGDVLAIVVAVIVALVCVGLILGIIAIVLRYVMETTVIRLVDEYEKTGERRGFRQGFRMGWSRAALRLFLMDLLVNIPVAVVFILLFALAALPLLAWAVNNDAVRALGTVASVCLILLVVVLVIIVSVVLVPLRTFFYRACVLEGWGVVAAIRRGYAVARRHLQDVVVMVLITTGLALIWAIATIPVALLLVVLGGVVAGVPALLVGWLASLAFKEAVPWILGLAVGLPIFLLVLIVPLTFLDGLMKVYQSATWTLTYRELLALEGPQESWPDSPATMPAESPEPA